MTLTPRLGLHSFFSSKPSGALWSSCATSPSLANRMSSSSSKPAKRLDQIRRHMASKAPQKKEEPPVAVVHPHQKWQYPTKGGGVNLDEPPVLFQSTNAARIFTLNRPKALNALSHDMIRMLRQEVVEVRLFSAKLFWLQRHRFRSC